MLGRMKMCNNSEKKIVWPSMKACVQQPALTKNRSFRKKYFGFNLFIQHCLLVIMFPNPVQYHIPITNFS